MTALLRDTRGATVVEFALVAPVLFMLVFGSIELGTNMYLRAVLDGAMDDAARSSSLQSAQAGQSAIDTAVRTRVQNVLPGATVVFTRRNYATFADVGRPEDFVDLNGNARYDLGECFTDANGNGTWDADMAASGLGGANDVVAYTATVSYAAFLPLSAFGIPDTRTLSATTTMRNQPFSVQASRVTRQVCG